MLELVRSKGVETTLPLVVTTVTRTPSWLCQTSVLVPLPIPPPPPSMFPSPVASTVMPVDNTRMSARISGKMVFCSCFMWILFLLQAKEKDMGDSMPFPVPV